MKMSEVWIKRKKKNQTLWKRIQKGAEKELKRSRKGAETKQKILDILISNSKTTQTELMEKLGISRKQVQILMKELQEEDLLSREGMNRNGKWIVKMNNSTIVWNIRNENWGKSTPKLYSSLSLAKPSIFVYTIKQKIGLVGLWVE